MSDEKSTTQKETRTRAWNIILYPESEPDNWREILDDLHIGWVESPLHEFDSNPTGERKKPHRHITLFFGGVKSYDQVRELTAPLNGPIPQRCHDARASVRYMAHMDNPEKFQYNPKDIKAHGGADLDALLAPTASERKEIIKEMILWVKETGCIEYQDLMDYAIEKSSDRWYPILLDSGSYVLQMYIRSQRHREKTQREMAALENKNAAYLEKCSDLKKMEG